MTGSVADLLCEYGSLEMNRGTGLGPNLTYPCGSSLGVAPSNLKRAERLWGSMEQGDLEVLRTFEFSIPALNKGNRRGRSPLVRMSLEVLICAAHITGGEV
jgi:hypothetical protein